ncbi:MAG: prepilin-type N-terminal cleavage/methylation domain-containing protein [Verrucomicrobia bacterium]|nr:prepilin-type N-terminal cleavage/methylation domain-containing protein [Verrucomicrobiota bacterium]
MNTRRSRPLAAGFTLLELTISAALMAVILVCAYLCLRAGVASQKLVDTRAEALQTARVALALISADLRSACPLSTKFEFLGMHRQLGDVQADNLDFATHHYAPQRPRQADYCEVSYFCESDRDPTQFTLWRRRNPTIAPDPLSGGSREEIARGVRGLRFQYYDGYDWYDDWGDVTGRRKERDSTLEPANLTGMPEAVRVTLWLDPNPPPAGAGHPARDTNEPPLVFQTVVRLNLADRPPPPSAGGATTNALPATSQPVSGPTAGSGS